MFHTGIRRSFTARHALRGDFGEESVPHSHPYQVEWRVTTEKLDENGFSVDISLMERVLEETLREVDSVLLNDLPFFSNRQPSVENTAVFLGERLSAGLYAYSYPLKRIKNMSITVWESESAWASYDFVP